MSGKTFLIKCVNEEKLREIPPKEASDIRYQLSKIDVNLMELSSSRTNDPKETVRLFKEREQQLNKISTDITRILYLATVYTDD